MCTVAHTHCVPFCTKHAATAPGRPFSLLYCLQRNLFPNITAPNGLLCSHFIIHSAIGYPAVVIIIHPSYQCHCFRCAAGTCRPPSSLSVVAYCWCRSTAPRPGPLPCNSGTAGSTRALTKSRPKSTSSYMFINNSYPLKYYYLFIQGYRPLSPRATC